MATQIKAILIGDSGSGKTGSIAALANAGYNIRALDYDSGLQIWSQYLTPEARKRVYYETLTDKFFIEPDGKMNWEDPPLAYVNGCKLLRHWKMPERKVGDLAIPAYDLGNPINWGSDTILVMDSMTGFGSAAMRHVLTMNKASLERRQHPWPQDMGEAQNLVEYFLEFVRSAQLKCHVIVVCHVRRVGGGGTVAQEVKASKDSSVKSIVWRDVDTSEGKGYPTAPGRALSPKVARYFNTMLVYYTDEDTGRRLISTTPRDNIDAKTPAPKALQTTYNVEDGLLKIWQGILGVAK